MRRTAHDAKSAPCHIRDDVGRFSIPPFNLSGSDTGFRTLSQNVPRKNQCPSTACDALETALDRQKKMRHPGYISNFAPKKILQRRSLSQRVKWRIAYAIGSQQRMFFPPVMRGARKRAGMMETPKTRGARKWPGKRGRPSFPGAGSEERCLSTLPRHARSGCCRSASRTSG